MRYESKLLSRVGQILVEVHAHNENFLKAFNTKSPLELLHSFENRNMRLFHVVRNKHSSLSAYQIFIAM